MSAFSILCLFAQERGLGFLYPQFQHFKLLAHIGYFAAQGYQERIRYGVHKHFILANNFDRRCYTAPSLGVRRKASSQGRGATLTVKLRWRQ